MKAKPPAPGEGAGGDGGAKRTTPQPNPTSHKRQAIDELEALICATWPEAFDRERRRPLAIGTDKLIAERLELGSRKQLGRIMLRWTRHDRYLQALAEPGAWRVDLDARPAEPVSEDHQRAAVEQLEQHRRRRSGQQPTGAKARLPTLRLPRA